MEKQAYITDDEMDKCQKVIEVFMEQPSVFHVINETVLFVDTAAIFSLQVTGEGFRFPDSIHATVTLNVLNKLIDSL